MNVEPSNKKPAYIEQKEQSKGLKEATKTFESDVQQSSYTYKDYNYTRASADERVPETIAITKQVENNPQDYEVEYYDNGNYKEVRTKDETYLRKKRRLVNGKTSKKYSTYNETIYKFNPDGSIKQEIKQGIYKHRIDGGTKYSVYNDEIIDYDYNTGQIKKRDFREKNKAKANRLDYNKPVAEEYFTIKNNKVVVVDKKGKVLRTTITPRERTQTQELIKQYNKGIIAKGRDERTARTIIGKVNEGTATNKDYVDYLNISTKYGTDPLQVKQLIETGEANKQAFNVKPQESFYSVEQNFIDNNPNMIVPKELQIERFYNDKGQIVGISGLIGENGLGESKRAPDGSFFKESDIRNAELKATAIFELNKIKKNEPPKSPAQKLLDRAGGFFNTNLNKIGINLTQESEEAKKGFNILTSEIKSEYEGAKDFLSKNFDIINTTKNKDSRWAEGVSVGPVIESGIANNILLGVDDGEVKPLYQVLEAKREQTLELGIKQTNKMIESFTTDVEIAKFSGISSLNQKQNEFIKTQTNTFNDLAKNINIGANVAGELGLGIIDTGLLIGSKASRYPITTTGIVATGVGAYSIAPTLTAGAFVGLNAYDWASRPTAEEKFLAVGGDLGLSLLAIGAPKAIEAGITKLNPDYAKVEVDAIGRKVIKGVDVGDDIESSRVIDIDLVPEGKAGLKNVQVNPKLLLEEYGDAIPFKSSPNIPKTTKFQSDFLDILKEDEIKFATDSSVGGSFAQKAMLKKSRAFGDLDIVTDDPLLIAMKTKEKFGDGVAIKKVTITDSPLGNFDIYKVAQRQADGSLVHIADIDPIRFAEEGLASKYGSVEINGLPVTDIRSRFVAKVQQAVRGKRTEKVLQDIKILSDGKLTMDSQSIRGAFGWSFQEQAVFVDTTGDVITAQRGLFKNKLFNKYKEDVLINKPNYEGSDSLEASFFASPPDVVSGNPQLRASRLGLYTDNRADFSDLLSGNVQVGKGKPQAVLFPNAKIGAVPDELKGIFAKAKAGDVEAQSEFLRLYKPYQMTPTGEFKPFGYAGGEAELTLSPNEIISGEGQAGVTLINNQKVSIIKAKVKTASPELTALQTKAIETGLTNDETIKLNKLIDEESGGLTREVKPIIAEEDIISSSSTIREVKNSNSILLKNSVPYQETYTPRQALLSSPYSSKAIKFKGSSPVSSSSTSSQIVRVSSPINNSQSIDYSESAIDYSSRGVSQSPISIASPPAYSSPASSPVSPYSQIPSSQIQKTPESTINAFSKSNKRRNSGGYDVFVKTKGVWIQTNTQPIRSKGEAENFGRFITSTTPQASFQTKKSTSRAKPISFGKKINPAGFYRKGNVFIEKNKYRINTAGELKGITFKGLQTQSFKKNKSKNKWRLTK